MKKAYGIVQCTSPVLDRPWYVVEFGEWLHAPFTKLVSRGFATEEEAKARIKELEK